MNIEQEFDSIHNNLANLFHHHPDLVNAKNKELVFAYWKYIQGLEIDLKRAKRLHDSESIRRVLQKARESGLWKETDPNTAEAKDKKEKEVKQWAKQQ